MQLGRRSAIRPGADLGSNSLGNGGNVGNALRERFEVKPCSADENWYPSALARLREHVSDSAEPTADGKILGAVHRAVQRVRRPAFLVRCRPRGDDSQVTVHLHRVRVDHQAIHAARQLESERGLAARGRPCDEDRLQRTNGPGRARHLE